MNKKWRKKFTKTVEHNETEAQLNCNAVLSSVLLLFSFCVDIMKGCCWKVNQIWGNNMREWRMNGKTIISFEKIENSSKLCLINIVIWKVFWFEIRWFCYQLFTGFNILLKINFFTLHMQFFHQTINNFQHGFMLLS